MAENSVLNVRIASTKEDVFVGDAQSLSSVNISGPFDILVGHAKFVTLVEKAPIVLRFNDGTKKEFYFDLAIIRVKSDKVDVFVNPERAGQEIGKVA